MTRRELAARIDHTLLKPDATAPAFDRLCAEAREEGFGAVCVPPARVATAVRRLDGSDVAVCTVIDFPHGASTTDAAVGEAVRALADGARELDVVMPIGRLIEGDDDGVVAHLARIVDTARAAGGALVKVIIETGLLPDDDTKTRACAAVVASGADFVKTSTGFNAPTGATEDDVRLLHRAVAGRARVKASGGIGDLETALVMIDAGAERLGCSRSCAIMAAWDERAATATR
jgi:deoxyribose-phosphate aldolase